MRRNKLIISLILALSVILLFGTSVLASYTANINVVNTGSTAYTNLPYRVAIDNSYLAANGYTQSDMLDVEVKDNIIVLPIMPTEDYLLVVIPSLSASSTRQLQWSGSNDAITSFPIITGVDGYITTADGGAIKFGSSFELTMPDTYIDTSTGSNKYIVYKNAVLIMQVTGSKEITATVYDGSSHSIVLSSIDSGEYDVTLSLSGGTLTFTVGTDSDTASGVGTLVDNTNDIIWGQNDVTPYFGSINLEISGVPVLSYAPTGIISDDTLTDEVGSYDATITWGTNPTDVTATFTDFTNPNSGVDVVANPGGSSVDLLPPAGTAPYVTLTPTVKTNIFSPAMSILADITKLTPDGLNNGDYQVPVFFLWLIVFTFAIFTTMVLSLMYLPNQFVAAVVEIALSYFAYKMGIYPFAMVIIIAICAISILVWERKPAL